LRRRVTIIGKSAFKLDKDSHLIEAPKQKFVGSEANYKETVEEEDQEKDSAVENEEAKV
jgi:hypothetical protein